MPVLLDRHVKVFLWIWQQNSVVSKKENMKLQLVPNLPEHGEAE